MATVVINKPDYIEFKNVSATESIDEAPTVCFQAGSWQASTHNETGIIVDVFGTQMPLLSPSDARKLSKWLARAADALEGVKSDKKRKYRQQPTEDDEEFYE